MADDGLHDAERPRRHPSGVRVRAAAEHDRQGWIFAAAQMVLGSKGGIQNCAATFVDNHPLFRHNLFFGFQVDSTLKHVAEEEEANIP